ncbi:MAG: prolyl oligopeptidase family serine peptidase [Verrucomicrobia bacterium]|nr:prolyl oligopeptidase family serine peptidase [Verrucomicrobiota bacterium]
MKPALTFLTALLLALTQSAAAASEATLSTPPELWKDFDPDKGDFKEEVVKEETKGGVYYRDSYISAYVLGEEIRVFCKYAIKAGAKSAPGLLNVHGWMGMAGIDQSYVNDGWAVMAFDYCGQKDNRPHFTKYPAALDYGRMESKTIHAKLLNGKDITDPKQTSHYLWFAIQRRVLSYLLTQKEVDKTRIGAKGYSYGGTLMWNIGMDPRVKAIVAFFGIGWITYYRDHAIWMYNVPYQNPPMTPGERLYLDTVECQAHAPCITAATLWLTGSNDHHSGHERSEQTFKMFKPGVPWSFAIQARGHHNTEKLGDDCKLWLEKYVLGKDIAWPDRPKSKLVLGQDGVPELRVTPASPERITEVQVYEAQKTPNNIARSWRDVQAVHEGNAWIAKLPVLNVDDYVFSYANIRYSNNIVISSDFEAAIPSKLGKAVATDKRSDTISAGVGAWTDAAPAEGVGGVRGFRPLNNAQGTKNDQLGDPPWKAPHKAAFSFRFYCTEPQKLTLIAEGSYEMELNITASDNWQSMVVPANKLIHKNKLKRPLPDWSKVTEVQIKPKRGSDITKVIFADFKWVSEQSKQP